MPTIAIDPWFTIIPLASLVFISLAVGWFHWLPQERDWTLVIPAASLVSSLLCLVTFTYELTAAQTVAYVNVSDISRYKDIQERALRFQEPQEHAVASTALTEDFGYSQLAPHTAYAFTARPKSVLLAEPPITTIRDLDQRSNITWLPFILVALFVPAMAGSTVLRVTPGEFFDKLRGSLYVEQAFAQTGTVARGSKQLGPRTVSSYQKEKMAVRLNTKSKQEHRSPTTLEELEMEIAKSHKPSRQLTEDEIAEIKKPLYDRFVDS